MGKQAETMMSRAARVIWALSSIRLLPHIVVLLLKGNRRFLVDDLTRWATVKSVSMTGKSGMIRAFIRFMTFFPEYRNQFYYRIGWPRYFLQPLCRPLPTLLIGTQDIGPGLFIQHGFGTIVAARSIGQNCWINQQVTIGYSNSTDAPVIGDDVVIHAGAKVIGGITVGNNSKIGANAVVVKNVPENCTVVGVPAYIVRKNGVKSKEDL